MSEFKVGDRVEWCGSVTRRYTGTVVHALNLTLMVLWDTEGELEHSPSNLRLMNVLDLIVEALGADGNSGLPGATDAAASFDDQVAASVTFEDPRL